MIRAALAASVLLLLAACASRAPMTEPLPARTVQPVPAAPRSDASLRSHFVGNAQSMLGQPYRWGGSAPGGFDCSGLVAYAAAGAGIYVPRTAKEQQAFGTRIARSDLQPGDLVFMHLHRKDLHVGILIDGEHFIHSPATGGFVRIDRIQAEPYNSSIIDTRRIITDP